MFREDFVWGVASSALQIEGHDEKDGCGKTVWDEYCEAGKVNEGQDTLVACDHIHRYKEDFALMKALGIKHYRFSLNWARILPEGTGKVNEAGIQFYKDLIKEMKSQGITPYITMFHWEFPTQLQEQGGWLNPKSVEWFSEYARVVAENFSEDCEYFITFNEPQCFIGLGYLRGLHAPGLMRPYEEVFAMIHNVLKSHGAAVKTLRKYAVRPIQIGYAPTCGVALPATNSPEDIEAARECYLGLNPEMDNFTWTVSWFLDPVIFGTYPKDGLEAYKEYLPEITKEDMELIHQPIDFLGQNVYNGYPVARSEDGGISFLKRYPGFPKTATNWPVTPQCLYWGAKFLYEKYKMPLYITENGMACLDIVTGDGKVHDSDRIAFLDSYLAQLQKAAEEDCDIRGYFHWSFSDNFEWDKGYNERFGLVYIDYRNQKRIVKDSAYWYKTVMESNGLTLSTNHCAREMIFLKPVLKETIWGGDRLTGDFPYEAEGKIGECWGISAHPAGDCEIASGCYAGMKLSAFFQTCRGFFGNIADETFPLLVKFIDAKEKLSIQVHPDDAYAKVHENGSLGKRECWYIMDCDEDATLIVGHKARTRGELEEKVRKEDYDSLLRYVPIRKGDFISIEPGTIHAITGGVLLLETQQSSDITYRLYDYGRLENGKPRTLHVEKSLDVINIPDRFVPEEMINAADTSADRLFCLDSNEYYTVWKLKVANQVHFQQEWPFLLVSVISGSGIVNGTMVEKGAHMIIPAEYGVVDMAGEMELILSTVNEKKIK